MRNSPFLCSVHTHTTLCDGKDSMEDMVSAAYTAGVRYYGISSHSHTPIAQDQGLVLPQDMTAYCRVAERLQKQYEGKMEILLGLEWDSCSDVSFDGFAYWIGSVHYLQCQSGAYYAVDLDAETLISCQQEAFHGDVYAMIQAYFEQIAQVAALRPPILGHMDLITKCNAGNRFFDEEEKIYQEMALQALQAVNPLQTVLEVNTGAMARGYRKTPYPALFLLKEWRARGGQIVITADAHTKEGIVYGYADAIAFAEQAGFRESVILTANGWIPCPLQE